MDSRDACFLEALRCALRGEQVPWTDPMPGETWAAIRRLAGEQAVLPLVADAVLACPALADTPWERSLLRTRARSMTIHQAKRTAEFLLLLDELARWGLRPTVLKGLVCRSLYPQPEQRASLDEDLLIAPAEFAAYHEALLACGLQPEEGETPTEGADEITYRDDSRGLYLEVHLRLFSTSSEAYGDLNRFFTTALERTVELPIYGQAVRTLCPTDHLLFLMCHAYKHLLHGGVGVRQLCDICLFAEAFAEQIDWGWITAACAEQRLTLLATAMFQIGEKHLGIVAPSAFCGAEADELPLLADCLSGGLHGAEDPDRHHSGNLTLEAVAAEKQGRRSSGALRAFFLPAQSLEGRYPYLRKRPWLLPAAWTQRAWRYLMREKGNPGASLRIGQERIALLKQYEILP